jgi:hypothetical protein
MVCARVARFFLKQKPKWGKIHRNVHRKYQMAISNTKMAIKAPNGHEKQQNFPHQGLPKYNHKRHFWYENISSGKPGMCHENFEKNSKKFSFKRCCPI